MIARTRVKPAAVAVIGLFLLSACEPRGEADATPKSEDAADVQEAAGTEGLREFDRPDAQAGDVGGEVYSTVCAACHDTGVDRAPQPGILSLMTPESVYRALTEGVMKPQGEALTDEQKKRVAEFVTKRKLGDSAALPPPPKCAGPEARFDFGEPPVWGNWGLGLDNGRNIATELAGLDRASVGRLKLKWAFAFPNAVRARSHPMLAGGALYVGSQDGTVYALGRDTGCVRWTFTAGAEVRTAIVISDWKAGDEAARPLAYFGDIVGNVYAVDAQTGALVWKDRPDDHPAAMITAAPVLHEGRLYVPVSSLEVIAAYEASYECCKFRGSIVAYDAMSGARLWQTYSIAEAATKRGSNRVGTDQYGPSGAPIWNSPAIDEKRNQLYVGTGENYSSPPTGTSDAILAMDLDTGRLNWAYQGTANDAWNASCTQPDKVNCPKEDGPDFDFGAAPMLVRASDGKDYVVAGQKSGVVHGIDPDTGKGIWKTKVGRGGMTGGVHFGIARVDDRVIVPINDHRFGQTYTEPALPGLYALDVKTGALIWKAPAADDVCKERPLCNPGLGGAITATPELVFAGANDGVLRVYDVENGRVLWSYDTAKPFQTVSGAPAQGGAFGGAAAPLLHRGAMYVNSGYGFSGKMPGNVLLKFAIE